MLIAMMTLSTRNADVERAKTCFESLERYLDESLEIVIVSPRSEMAAVAAELQSVPASKLSFRQMADEDVIEEAIAADPKVRGTVKQMLIKLAFGLICEQPFYLTLDADVALVKPLSTGELFSEGRALIQTKSVSPPSRWCDAAAEILGTPFDYPDTMDVTPAIMSSAGVRALVDRLVELLGQDWQRRLAEFHASGTVWTEYTLYWHFLHHAGQLDALHFRDPRKRIFLMRNIWRPENVTAWDLEVAKRSPGWFAVIQSTSGLTPGEAREKLGLAG